MSKLTEWIDDKYIQIMTDAESFFAKERSLKDSNLPPVFINYFSKGNDFKRMRERVFDDAEELYYCFMKYQEIMAYINERCVLPPSKQSFTMFIGWSTNTYDKVLKTSTDEMKEVMQMIEDYLVGTAWASAQNGSTKSNATKSQLQTAGSQGHGLVTQKEQNLTDYRERDMKAPEQLVKELMNMGAKVIG